MPDSEPQSVAAVRDGLGQVGYLADEAAALVSFLAQRLGKPVLVEGPAGVGKTELAKALSRSTGRRLVRLRMTGKVASSSKRTLTSSSVPPRSASTSKGGRRPMVASPASSDETGCCSVASCCRCAAT